MNTNMKRAMVYAGILMLSAQAAHAAGEKRFSEPSIKGCYVSSLLGSLAPDPTNPASQLAMSSLVRFCADGKGDAKVVATQNIGGACIVDQEGKAKYSVDQNGMGVAVATLENVTVSEGCSVFGSLMVLEGKADFELRFAIQRDKCLQVIGTGLVPEGEPPVGIVLQGEACPQ